MATKLEDVLKEFSPRRQAKIKKRANQLIAQELTLQNLRKALELTQNDLSHKLHMNQEAISRLERRSDLLLSTLNNYINAMGGELTLIAKFPNHPPVKLTGLAAIKNSK